MKFVWTKQEIKNFLDEQNIECRYSIERYFANRSIQANRYYWWVVVEILRDYIWETSDNMHEILKYKFLKDKTWEYFKIKDTKSLNTKEFEEYLNNIRQWAAIELLLNIPEPNEIIN